MANLRAFPGEYSSTPDAAYTQSTSYLNSLGIAVEGHFAQFFLPICSICISNHAGNLNALRTSLEVSKSRGAGLYILVQSQCPTKLCHLLPVFPFLFGRLSKWYILQRRGLSSAQSGRNFMNFIWIRNWFSFCRIGIVKTQLPWHRYFQPFYLFKFQPLPVFYLPNSKFVGNFFRPALAQYSWPI